MCGRSARSQWKRGGGGGGGELGRASVRRERGVSVCVRDRRERVTPKALGVRVCVRVRARARAATAGRSRRLTQRRQADGIGKMISQAEIPLFSRGLGGGASPRSGRAESAFAGAQGSPGLPWPRATRAGGSSFKLSETLNVESAGGSPARRTRAALPTVRAAAGFASGPRTAERVSERASAHPFLY